MRISFVNANVNPLIVEVDIIGNVCYMMLHDCRSNTPMLHLNITALQYCISIWWSVSQPFPTGKVSSWT